MKSLSTYEVFETMLRILDETNGCLLRGTFEVGIRYWVFRNRRKAARFRKW